jgi:hypothetical protein
MSNFTPAFEVTRVDSMQWNRTQAGPVRSADAAEASAAPLPDAVVERVREAIKREAGYVTN